MKIFIVLASMYGATGVVLGAFGAHYLKTRLSESQLLSWETGVRYQLIHAVVLLVMALLLDKGLALKTPMFLTSLGVMLFSGSIYLLCLEIGPKAIWGPITPLGGLCLIAGWAGLLIAACRG